nr:helix-turn-helix domain protein [uncultured bacterium]
MKSESLKQIYAGRLTELHSAENQLIHALPAMAEAACSYRVKELLEQQLIERQEQVKRLDHVLEANEVKPGKSRCPELRDVVAEASYLIDVEPDLEMVDAGLVAAGHKAVNFYINAYGAVIELAEILGDKDSLKSLQQSLREEKAAHEKFEAVAARCVPLKTVAA